MNHKPRSRSLGAASGVQEVASLSVKRVASLSVKRVASLSASQEMYLKTILSLQAAAGTVRASDIAAQLGVRKPSVTGALRQLAEKGFVDYAPYGAVTLSKSGARLAGEIADRFEALKSFFMRVLCIGEGEAHAAACRMEHALPPEVWERLVKFIEYMERCPRGPARWQGDRQGFVCVGRRKAPAGAS